MNGFYRKAKAREGGFTLIEMVMVAAILGLVIMLVPPLLNGFTRLFLQSRAKLELQRESKVVMRTIETNLSQGRAGTLRIDRADADEIFWSSMTFTRIDGAFALSDRTITYYQQENEAVEDMEGQSRVLSKNVKFLNFSVPRTDEPGVVTVTLTLEKETFGGRKLALHTTSNRVRVANP